jgi:hypothetical protein
MTTKICLPCIIGVLVLVVGGIIVVKIIKTCQKLFPDPPNNSSTNSFASFHLHGQVQAVQWMPIGLAAPCNDCETGMVATLTYTLSSNGPALMRLKVSDRTSFVTAGEFSADMASLGVTNLGQTYGSIALWSEGGVLVFSQAADARMTVVMRSTNAIDWVPLWTNQIAPGQIVEYQDDNCPAPIGMYRVVSQ